MKRLGIGLITANDSVSRPGCKVTLAPVPAVVDVKRVDDVVTQMIDWEPDVARLFSKTPRH